MPTFTDSILIAAPANRVWHALTDPEASRLWRGAEFVTDWQTGSPLLVRRAFGLKTIDDHGRVVLADSPNRLTLTFLPSISHLPDRTENYSTIDMVLTLEGNSTLLTVTHTVPEPAGTAEKMAKSGLDLSGEKHVAFYWRSTLPLLRDLVEGNSNPVLDMARRAAGT
jgi:uncharacterized protein YndB with AHSA1/START domain